MFGIFTSILSGITSLFSGVGPTVCNIAANLVAALPKALEIGKIVLHAIAEVVVKTAQIIEISPENENVEELGAKAMQEDTRPRMDDESMEDYLDYLRNEVTLDKEKLLMLSEENKIKCQAVGVGMLSEAIFEKNGVELSPAFLIAMNKMRMSAEILSTYLKEFSKNEINTMDILLDYLKGNLSDMETKDTHNIIRDIEKHISPDANMLEIQEKIEKYKDAVKQDETEL